VSIIEISPTTVLLDIQPPANTGGVEIYGFRVQYLLKIDDFMIGIFSLTFSVLIIYFNNDNNQIYKVPYGRNFRGVGDMADRFSCV